MFFDREVLKEIVEEIYVDKYVERVVSASIDQSEYFSRKGPSGCALTKVPKAKWVLEMCVLLRARVRACVRAARPDCYLWLLMLAMTGLT